jgi:hypothetical protein
VFDLDFEVLVELVEPARLDLGRGETVHRMSRKAPGASGKNRIPVCWWKSTMDFERTCKSFEETKQTADSVKGQTEVQNGVW